MKHPSARQLAPVTDALAKKANFEWMPTNVFLLQSAVYGLIKRIEDGNFKSAKDAFDLRQLLQIAKSFETENPDIQEITEMGATLMDWLRYTPQSRSPHDTIALHLQWRDLKEYLHAAATRQSRAGPRSTFASRLAMAGHNDGTIAALLRHSGTVLVKRYAHLSPITFGRSR